ncbi:MAG: tetratricopeptide repeat protein [Verrucomicrobiota bacterium]
MKRFLLLALAFTATLHAQNSKPAEKGVDDLSASQREFTNLPEEKRTEFIKLYTEAQKMFSAMRVFETLEKLHEAEKIFPNSVELLNLRGSCYVEMRIFDKAEIAFKRALEISPNNLSVMFNVAECMFVSRQWQASHDKLQELLKLMPANALEMSRLIEFKILLCKKKLGLDKEAQILADKYDYQDDSPYYYYAQAAMAFDKKELVEAEQWMARAARIFRDPKVISPWQDTMMEYGYIKGFFGGEEEAEESK